MSICLLNQQFVITAKVAQAAKTWKTNVNLLAIFLCGKESSELELACGCEMRREEKE
jgi:hypothetical protein